MSTASPSRVLTCINKPYPIPCPVLTLAVVRLHRRELKQKKNIMTDNYEILQALYDVGEKIIEKSHIRHSEDTASGIAKYYKKHCYVFTEETNQHPFTVIVGSFRCEASPAAIFYLIYKFELLNNIKPKDRKVFKFNQ